MTLDIFKEKGVPLDRQVFTWRALRGQAGVSPTPPQPQAGA